MRDLFRGYYLPTDEEFEELWTKGWVVFDANVLLNLYRYAPGVRDDLLRVLDELASQLWIPYQAAEEYQRSRLSVLMEQFQIYRKFNSAVDAAKTNLSAFVTKISRHPTIDSTSALAVIESSFKTLSEYVTDLETARHGFTVDDVRHSDPLQLRLTALFDGKVGNRLSDDERAAIALEGAVRYKNEVPPGYKDADKDESLKFGDLIIWKEMMRHAASTAKPIIYVTDDLKEDWWQQLNGQTIGPRPELIAEFWDYSNQLFYMYNPLQFIERVKLRGGSGPSDDTVDAVRQLAFADKLHSSRAALESMLQTILLNKSRAAFRELSPNDPVRDRSEDDARLALSRELRLQSLGRRLLRDKAELEDVINQMRESRPADQLEALTQRSELLAQTIEETTNAIIKLNSDAQLSKRKSYLTDSPYEDQWPALMKEIFRQSLTDDDPTQS
jgi:PIN like domain